MLDLSAILRARVDATTARNWLGRIYEKLTKRDADDLRRLRVRLTDSGLIRMMAANYMDPMFCGSREEKVYRAFGEAIETAYHAFLADLDTAREGDKATIGFHYLREAGYGSVVYFPSIPCEVDR